MLEASGQEIKPPEDGYLNIDLSTGT